MDGFFTLVLYYYLLDSCFDLLIQIEDASKEHENLKETENTEKTEDNNIPSGDAVKTDI